MVVKHLRLHLEYLKVALATAMEYKVNFLIQVFSMIANDIIWIIYWILFFTKIDSVKGYDFDTVILLYAIITAAYGFSGFLFGNRKNLAEFISKGKLDFYLALPKNPYYHMLISRSSFYDLGDVIFGFTLALFFLPFAKLPLYLVFVITGTIIFISFGMLAGSLAFYLGNAEGLSRELFMGMLSFGSYPMSIYRGFSKFILLTIIPAGFLTGVPVELLINFDLTWFLLTIGFSFTLLAISIAVFYHGIKRYESGNLLHVRI